MITSSSDEYKDDFYKGLTLRQSVISLITIAVGAVVYLTLTGVLHLPQSLALYLTLPVVFPIAAYGFLKIHGMNIAEYLRKRGAVKERSSYAFIPQMLIEEAINNTEQNGEQLRTGKTKILYLETEDSIRDLDIAEEEMQLT
jgi:hypothetical protein